MDKKLISSDNKIKVSIPNETNINKIKPNKFNKNQKNQKNSSIQNQLKQLPVINIGMVGHVMNGKTTLVNKLTGVNTKKHKNEKIHGHTIKLGYANGLLWKCFQCDTIECTSQKKKKIICKICKTPMKPKIKISFADMPGHHSFINTMIKGSSVIDAALVITDVKQTSLQMQTLEHLAILEIMGVKNSIIIQNKCDLVNKKKCHNHYNMLKTQLENTIASDSPIIPICAQKGFQIDAVVKTMYNLCCKIVNSLENELSKQRGFAIIRTFDVNKPKDDIDPDTIKGGVIGGCVFGGETLQVGDNIEIRPGIICKDAKTGDITHQPLRTDIISIFSETQQTDELKRGGLYAIGTKLDPSLTRSDRLVGNVAGKPEHLPCVKKQWDMKIYHMKKGFNNEVLPKIKLSEKYIFVLGNCVAQGKIISKHKKKYNVEFNKPVCIYVKKCIIYRQMDNDLQMIGFGVIV